MCCSILLLDFVFYGPQPNITAKIVGLVWSVGFNSFVGYCMFWSQTKIFCENLLTLSPDIEQACVFGEQKNFIAALIILANDSKSTKDDIQNYINRINKDLTQPEKIKKFSFIDEHFTIENNLMTPTMKVRRHEVKKKYAEIIDQLF